MSSSSICKQSKKRFFVLGFSFMLMGISLLFFQNFGGIDPNEEAPLSSKQYLMVDQETRENPLTLAVSGKWSQWKVVPSLNGVAEMTAFRGSFITMKNGYVIYRPDAQKAAHSNEEPIGNLVVFNSECRCLKVVTGNLILTFDRKSAAQDIHAQVDQVISDYAVQHSDSSLQKMEIQNQKVVLKLFFKGQAQYDAIQSKLRFREMFAELEDKLAHTEGVETVEPEVK